MEEKSTIIATTVAASLLLAILFACPANVDAQTTIDLDTFRDKLEGGWVGQMAGVAWGASTEAQWQNSIIPIQSVPTWSPSMINSSFNQDDCYVEIPFIDAMNNHGVNASWTDFGDYFKVTQFPLWVANKAGRDNLLAGIDAPWSGHPTNNQYYQQIDWQIESNFAASVAPGLPTAAADIAWRGGHVMNYGDGVYGGVSFAAMQAAAYTATDFNDVIEVGRNILPLGSGYRQMVDDMINWYNDDSDKTTWQDTWQLAQDKWGAPGWLDAKSNGAKVFLGLLYGQTDIQKAMEIAMRGGDDSDCNPSSAAAVIGTFLGLSNIPDQYKSALDRTGRTFSYTDYNFEQVINDSEQLARQALLLRGGSIEVAGDSEVWTIPDDPVNPVILEKWPGAYDDTPVLTASIDDVTDEGYTITLSAQATDSDGIAQYQWFMGDLSYKNGMTVTHTYAQPGLYEVIAYVADNSGNTSWKMLEVFVPTCSLGDINCDGQVGLLDLDILGQFYGQQTELWSQGDLNGDGTVGLLDLDILGEHYRQSSPTTPEPASLALMLAAACYIITRRAKGAGKINL